MLDGARPDQGPLQVVPGSHKGQIYAHYDAQGNWTGAIPKWDIERIDLSNAVPMLGPPGSLSVHHSRTIHGSERNTSATGRPAFGVTYSAADANPDTSPAYPSVRYNCLVRGSEPVIAYHAELFIPLPPDWSGGYTSKFNHQQEMMDERSV